MEKTRLEKYKKVLEQSKGVRAKYNKELEEIKQELKESNILLEQTLKAQKVIQTVAQDTQNKLKFHIQDIVQLALDTCYPEVYKFCVDFEIKRGKTEAKLFFLKDGEEINPIEAAGGGVVDLAAFALRIAAWSLGKSDNTIVLDEPFKHLSKDLQPKAGEILNQLSKRLKLQIIMVTHNEDMAEYSDSIFQVKISKGVSSVEKID